MVGVSKGMLSVKYFCSNMDSFFVSVEFDGDHKTVTNMRLDLATLSLGDIAGFKIVYICVVLGVCIICMYFMLCIYIYMHA